VVILPIHDAVTFVLVTPHYPENVGAAARAIKTMGFGHLTLVRPGRLAMPTHEMARKMAVKSLDVLERATLVASVEDAIAGSQCVVATTSRRGQSGVLTPRPLAREVVERVGRGEQIAILFGNEKTGLSAEEVALAHRCLRIPMAAEQPSINLAQAVQVIAYELLTTALIAQDAS